MARQIALQHLEIGKSALRSRESKRNQAACRIVDEDDQRAARSAILKPAVFAPIDLDQLAEMLAADARLVKLAPLLALEPQAFRGHPLAERLSRDGQAVPFE
jgi:hypothetical protein